MVGSSSLVPRPPPNQVAPASLALCTPITIGFGFKLVGNYTGNAMEGIEVVSSFLVFASLSGLIMAIFFDNAGGAWDNAKKLVNAGHPLHACAPPSTPSSLPFSLSHRDRMTACRWSRRGRRARSSTRRR